MWNKYGVSFGERLTLGLEMVLKQVTITALREDGTRWESAKHAGI